MGFQVLEYVGFSGIFAENPNKHIAENPNNSTTILNVHNIINEHNPISIMRKHFDDFLP